MTMNLDTNTVGNDALKLTLSKFITLAISIVSAMLLSRFRTLEEFGTYSQILLVINISTVVITLGLPNSINYFLSRAENQEERVKFLSIYYSFSLFLGITTGLVLILSAELISIRFNNPYIMSFIFVFALFPTAKIVLSSIENVLIVYKKTNLIMSFRILNSIFLLASIFIIEWLEMGFREYMISFVVIELIFSISVYYIVFNLSGRIKVNLDFAYLKTILKFSLPIGFASIIGVVSVELDKLIINIFFSVEEAAIYANAAREMPVTIISISLTAVLMPKLVILLKSNKISGAIKLWNSSIIISYTFICFFSIGLFVFAPDVIALLYSSKYLPGVKVFRIYSIILLLRVTYFGIILNSIGKTKFILYSSLISLLLNVVLSIGLYYVFGYIGPAIATLTSLLLVQLLQLSITCRTINIRFRAIMPWRDIARITAYNIILGLIFYFLKTISSIELTNSSLIESILLGFIWGIIIFAIEFKRIKATWVLLNSPSGF
ncbi:MAG: oligosaccharide flippase family protein [Tenericutes bacterium]|nr:oligosaccharide flippase family protein [Mycoplasmatota bacterium]